MPTTDSTISRAELVHPDLNHDFGALLHSKMTTLLTRLGDFLNSRFFTADALAHGASVDFDHNFKSALSDLVIGLYIRDTGTGELTRITDFTTPNLSQFTIVATPGFTTTQIRVTNSSGSSRNIAMVVLHSKIPLSYLHDLDLTTVLPQDGQALVYRASDKKWIAGASGDSSFKLQTVSTPNLEIKGGYLRLDDGREIATHDGSGSASTDYGTDLSINLTTILGASPADATAYYLYIDLEALGSEVTLSDTGRKLFGIAAAETSKWFLSTSSPYSGLVNRGRYRYIGGVRSATTGNAWSGTGAAFWTASEKAWDNGPVAINPVVYTDEDHSIGVVGSAGQLATYGALTTADFPTPANAHVYPLNNNSNDLGSSPINLTQQNSPQFRKKSWLGGVENLMDFDGVNKYLSTNNSTVFNPANGTSWSFGMWIKARWATKVTGSPPIFAFGGNTSTDHIVILFQVDFSAADKQVQIIKSTGGTQGSSGINNQYKIRGWADDSWHHFALVRVGAGSLSLYVDGELAATVASETLENSSTNHFSTIGTDSNSSPTPFEGTITDFFLVNGDALTAAQVKAIYSKRFKKQQLAGGHILDSDSFPFASLLGKAVFYPLSANGNDGSVNAKNLTANGSPVFTAFNINGVASAAARFDGVDDNFSSTDAIFNPGNGRSFSVGGWFRLDKWKPSGTNTFFANHPSGSDRGYYVFANTNGLNYFATNTAGADDFGVDSIDLNLQDGSLHHIALVFDYSRQVLMLFVDGVEVSSTPMTNMRSITSSLFRVGALATPAANFMTGSAHDVFFVVDYAMTAADMRKIVAARLDLTGLPTPQNQEWSAEVISEDGLIHTTLEGQAFVVDKSPTGKVWVDFGGQTTHDPASRVTLRCKDLALTAQVVPSTVPYDNTFTSAPTFPFAHGLPEVPKIVLLAKDASNDWHTIASEGYVKADATNFKGDIANLFTLGYTAVRLRGEVGNSATGVKPAGPTNDGILTAQNYEGFTDIKTATYTAVRGDKVLTNTTAAGFTCHLPAAPQPKDRVSFYDAKNTWGDVGKALTVGRNGKPITGLAEDATLDTGGKAEFVYIDDTYGWGIF